MYLEISFYALTSSVDYWDKHIPPFVLVAV